MEKFNLNEIVNFDVLNKYLLTYNSSYLVEHFFESIDNQYYVKSEFNDFIRKVPFRNVQIIFVVVNDSSIASRRYQESFLCQTPMCYAYDDLVRLFLDNVPKVRQRNAVTTYLEPLLPLFCAQSLILESLIYSTQIKGTKNITFTLTSKSLKVSYTHNKNILSNEIISERANYFKIMGVDLDHIQKAMDSYIKEHRPQYRYSYFDGIKTTEILYNVRKSTFKKYYTSTDKGQLLSKAEYDIYNFIKDRGGASLALITEEFGYRSIRAAKYHTDKLIALKLIQMVGKVGSHNSIYRVVISH